MARSLVLHVALLFSVASATGCIDNNGKPVDWWFTYKLPNGFRFAYADNKLHWQRKDLVVFDRDLDDKDNPVALTRTLRSLLPSGTAQPAALRFRSALSQPPEDATDLEALTLNQLKHRAAAIGIGKDHPDHPSHKDNPADGRSKAAFISAIRSELTARGQSVPYLMYNDQPDNGNPSSSYGHSKGVFAPHKFWLIHSTPHFPAPAGTGKFWFPEKETKFGQTFLCISIGAKDTEHIANHFKYTTPYVYFTNLHGTAPDVVASSPSLADVLDGKWADGPGTATHSITTAGGEQFQIFGKNAAWNADLWGDLVAPALQSNMLVESWIRGQALGPYCKGRGRSPGGSKWKYDVVDVHTMEVTDQGKVHTWKETQDHAKWAITDDHTNLVCIGDINRMTSQRKRGGGTACFSHGGLATALWYSIRIADKCQASDPWNGPVIPKRLL